MLGTFKTRLVLLASVNECVTLTDAHNYLTEATQDRDPLISSLIPQAREIIELRTARQFMPATWVAFADGLPPRPHFHAGERLRSERDIRAFDLAREPIDLRINPVQQIDWFQYVDTTNTTQQITLNFSASAPSNSNYQADFLSEPARLAPAYNQIWPPVQAATLNAVQIQFEAGYSLGNGANPTGPQLAAQQAAVPQSAKNVILWLVDKWYNSPEMTGRVDASWEEELAELLEPLIWSPYG